MALCHIANCRRSSLSTSRLRSSPTAVLSTIFKSAVADRRLSSSPCLGTRLPKVEKRKVPISTEQVLTLVQAMPERYQALVMLTIGTGMSQGEVFGLSVDGVDFLRRSLTVDRQLVAISGRLPSFGPPKTAAGVRTIPLPSVVVDALAPHLTTFPTQGLIFTNEAGDMLRRSNFGTMWRRVTKSVDLEGLHFHDLRHYYASLLIRHGESVKTVQARLGHANAAETRDTYSHLWPDSDDRTREAVDHVLGKPAEYILSAASTS